MRLSGEVRIEKEKGIMQVRHLLPYLALSVLTAALLFLPISEGEIFGSEGDWYSQHVGAAEAIRQTMLRQETVFPQHAGLGGGINAYDLAYYGLLRPDILLAYLLPGVPMGKLISLYAAAGVFASVNLTFFWLKRKNLDTAFAFCGGVLTAAAACFFHAHHQIIFVNYIPFLVTAFLGTDRLLSAGKSGLLTISVFLICIHSFYYAPMCLLVCLIYGLHQLGTLKKEDLNLHGSLAGYTLHGVFAAVLGVCLSAVLLLPAGIDILSAAKDAGSFLDEPVKLVDLTFESLLYQPYGCGMSLTALYCLAGIDILSAAKDAGSFLDEPVKLVDLTFESLLYQPYGCGMSLTALYCLLLSLADKKKRLLSAVLLVILTVPYIWFVLSGFLYPRAKILIPLLPILVWICADTFSEIYNGRQKTHLLAAALCFVPVFFAWERGYWSVLACLDGGVLLVFMALQCLKKLPEKVKRKSLAMLLLVPVCTSLGVNFFLEDYLAEDDGRQSRFSFADITMFASEPYYRFDYLANNYINSNVLPDGALNKTASYLSVSNDIYEEFFYNTMRNPISLRNRVVLMPSENPLFNWFMGIRYILTKENRVPYGYQTVFRKNGFVLAENENVLPICYGTDSQNWFMGIRYILTKENRVPYGYQTVFRKNGFVLAENENVLPICYGTDSQVSEKELKQADFPAAMAALCGVSVRKEDGEKFFAKKFPNGFVQAESMAGKVWDKAATEVPSVKTSASQAESDSGRCILPLTEPLKNRVLILCFDIVRRDGREVCISVNGMKNNLSSKSAPYPNRNETFTFVLAQENGAEALERLTLDFSKGDYHIKDLQVFTADMPSAADRHIWKAEGDRSSGKFTFSEGSPVFSGTVDMEQDGYFVTSYPYKKGYRILADGKPVRAEKVNGAFTGFSLKRGFHRIRITYIAPGFRWGFCISSAAAVIFLLTALWGPRRNCLSLPLKTRFQKWVKKDSGKRFQKKQVGKTGRRFGKSSDRNFKKSCKKSFGNREGRKI